MKRLILNILLTCFAVMFLTTRVHSQYLSSLEIIPENPTTNDEVFLVAHTWSTSIYNSPESIVDSSSDTIEVRLCFYIGGYNPAQPNYYYDTISLGFFDSGEYALSFSIYSSFDLQNPCSNGTLRDDDSIGFYVDRFLNLNELGGNDISIYPNPTNNIVQVKSSKPLNQIELMNQIGQVVLSPILSDETISIETSALESGVYILCIIDVEGNRHLKRLVKN